MADVARSRQQKRGGSSARKRKCSNDSSPVDRAPVHQEKPSCGSTNKQNLLEKKRVIWRRPRSTDLLLNRCRTALFATDPDEMTARARSPPNYSFPCEWLSRLPTDNKASRGAPVPDRLMASRYCTSAFFTYFFPVAFLSLRVRASSALFFFRVEVLGRSM